MFGGGGRVGCAYSVGPEGCDAPSSPEPAVLWFGEGGLGERRGDFSAWRIPGSVIVGRWHCAGRDGRMI